LPLQQNDQLKRPSTPARVSAAAPVLSVLPDFALVADVDARKQQFFDFLEAYVNAENRRLLQRRETLMIFSRVLANGQRLSPSERLNLAKFALDYRIDFDSDTGQRGDAALVEQLLRRVDAIPVSLVLAQAANESAWGTSRFAVDGNNLFGQWCYEEGCGFVPLERADKASHEVRKFNTIAAAVSAYFKNLNTHPSYQHFRRMRAHMRDQEKILDPIQLAYGLGSYSQRGDNYIDEVQTIIQQNALRLRDDG
jgi:Bax protein